MKKIQKNLWMLMAIMVVVLVSSCSKVPKSAKLIPSDAAVVVRMDVKGAMEQSGVGDDSGIKDRLKKAIKDADMGKKLTDAVVGVIDDPVTLGLDLRDPVFFYATDKGKVAFVGSVYKKDSFTEFLNVCSKEMDGDKVKEKDDYCTLVDGRSILVYNDDMFYFGERQYSEDEDDFIKEVKELFEAKDAKNTMAESENMKALCKADGFVQTLINMEAIASMKEFKEVAKMMPGDLDLGKLAYIFTFGIDNDKATFTAELLTQDEKWLEYIDNSYSCNKDINPELLKYASEDGAAIFLDVNMTEYMKKMDFDAMLKQMPDEARKMARKFLDAIDGEAVFAFNDFDMENEYPTLSMYVKLTDESIKKTLEENLFNNMEADGSNQWKMPIAYGKKEDPFWGGYTRDYDNPVAYLTAGVKNSQLYVLTGADNKPFAKAGKAFPESLVKGKGAYMYLSAKLITNILSKVDNPYAKAALDIVKVFDYAECYSEGKAKGVLNIYGKNKGKNIVSEFVKAVTSFVESIGSAVGEPEVVEDDLAVDTVAVDWAAADSAVAEY